MFRERHQSIKAFYSDILDHFSKTYPALLSDKVSWIKVLHAFNDKLPLVEALSERNLITALILKQGSEKFHPDIARQLRERVPLVLTPASILMPDNAVHALSNAVQKTSFVLGDHGGNFAKSLLYLSIHFGPRLLGIIEHTRNGEERIQSVMDECNLNVNFLSSARSPLKADSDKVIASSIIDQILENSNSIKNIHIVGYGTMGAFAVERLKEIRPDIAVTIVEANPEKVELAKQNGFNVEDRIGTSIENADVVLLATNKVNGQGSVLNPQDIFKLKTTAIVTSMTSINDEIDKIGLRLLKNRNITIMNGGTPANTVLPDGGADMSICKVEAQGIVSAFAIAESGAKNQTIAKLPDADLKAISDIYYRRLGRFIFS